MEGLVKDSCWNNIVVDDIEVLERVSSNGNGVDVRVEIMAEETKGAFRGNELWLLI